MRGKAGRISAKVLSIIVLVWVVSAVYSLRVGSEKRPATRNSFGDPQEAGVFSLIWDNFAPTKLNISARAAIVIDGITGNVLFAKNQDMPLPIASLTKLATALTFLETNPDLNDTVTITDEDKQGAGRSRLYVGEKITLYDCLHMCLMRSDNAAARALARSTGYSMEKFVFLMNNLAFRMGLENTHFVDPTGLYSGNVSSAEDYVKLARLAFDNEIISEITSKKSYQFRALNKKVNHTVYNTNRLVYGDYKIKGGKTGYISQSGYCLALNVLDDDGRPVTAVLLGSPSNGYRYKDAKKLLTLALND